MRGRVGPLLVVAGWIVAAAAGFAAAPRLKAVSRTDPAAFFPADAPHRADRREIETRFPGAAPLSQVVLVVEADGPVLEARERIAALAEGVRRLDADGAVTAVLSPTDDSILERRLVAPGGRAALVVVQTAAGFASEAGGRLVGEVERLAAEAAAPGLRILLSGDATLGRDYDVAIEEGGRRSAWATILIVGVILLAVHRSPVAAAVSVLTLAAALGAAQGAVVLAASLGLPVAYQTRAFLVAIVYGVGTDYFLLLAARLREEHAAGAEDPLARAWSASLPVLAGSAAAVALACGLMGFARFGLFRFSGPALAVGVAAAAAATLTLSPALMRLLGRGLFWPGRPETVRPNRFWPGVARLVLGRPLATLLVVGAAVAPLAAAGARVRPTFENEIDVPAGSPSEAGYAALRRHFRLASVAPLALVVRTAAAPDPSHDGFQGTDGLDAVYHLTERLAAFPGVAAVRSATRPTGEAGLLARGTVWNQLAEVEAGLREARAGARALGRGIGEARREVAHGVHEAESRGAAVEEERRRSLVGLLAPRRLDEARRDLEALRADLERLEAGLARAAAGAETLAGGLDRGAARLHAVRSAPGAGRVLDRLALSTVDLADSGLRRALAHYATPSGDAALVEIELVDPPNAPGAVRTLRALRARLPAWLEADGLPGASAHLGGATPITADLEEITSSDLRRIGLLVVGGVFLLLVLLLGGLAAPAAVTAYLLVSYLAALGVLALCVRAGVWPGVDWKVPFFLLVLLVALGADYGIFLLGRAREEAARSPFAEALARALTATGPVVSSCGIVLAGTFAALLLSRIAFLEQVGLGVTTGVLVDTLLVRPFLLPATALLLQRRG